MPYALVPCAFEIIVMADFSDYAKSWSQPLETSPLPPMPIATKLGRVATYCEGLPPIKSYGTLTTWVFLRSCDKLKALDLHYHNSVATKLGRMVTFLEGLVQIKSHYPLITWLCEIMWQIKNISHCLNSYGHQIWQCDDLPWGAPTQRIALPFNHLVLRNYLTN